MIFENPPDDTGRGTRRRLDWRVSRADGRTASPLRRPPEEHLLPPRRATYGARRRTAPFGLPDYVASEIEVDSRVLPMPYSNMPGLVGEVEQAEEFVRRYFKSQGRHFPTMGQPATFLMTGRDHVGRAQPAFERHMNGGAVAPQAGDILVARGGRPGQFHTALVTAVDLLGVHVLQSNVPRQWQGGRVLRAVYALGRSDVYTMPPLPLAARGHGADFPVLGWIRPTGADALPTRFPG